MFSRKIIWLALCAALPVSLHALAEEASPPAQERVLQGGVGSAQPANGEPVDVLLADPDAAASAVAAPVVSEPDIKPATEPAPEVPEARPAEATAQPEVTATSAEPEIKPVPEVIAAPVEPEAKPVEAAVQLESVPVVEASEAKPVEPVPVAIEPEPVPAVEAPKVKPVTESAPVTEPQPDVSVAPAEPETKPAPKAAAPVVAAEPEIKPATEPVPEVAAAPVETEAQPAAEVTAPTVSAEPEIKPVEAAPVVIEPQPVPVAEAPEVKPVAESAPVAEPQPEVSVAPAEPEAKPVEPVPVAIEPQPVPVAEAPEVKPVAESAPVAEPQPEVVAAPVEPEAKPVPEVAVPPVAAEPEIKPATEPVPEVAAAPAEIEVKPAVAETAAAQPEPVPAVVAPEAKPVAIEPQPVPAVEVPEVKPVAESVPVAEPQPDVSAAPAEPELKPVPVPETVAAPAEPTAKPLSADTPSKAFAAAQASVQSVVLEKPPEFKPVAEVKPHVDSAVIQGGPLQAGAKPSAQELLERAKYWDSRGRRDIADKLRNQYRQETHEDATDAGSNQISARNAGAAPSGSGKTVVRTLPAAKVVAAEPVAPPTRQELLERAKYWEVRGRTDLAEKISAQAATPKPADDAVASEKPVRSVGVQSLPAVPVAPVAQVATVARPVAPVAAVLPVAAKPESDSRAQYWAARGRSDLAQEDSAPAKAAAPVARVEKRVQVAMQDKAEPAAVQTAQQLDASAQYWDARGRPDLASQVRAKLQQIEPAARPGSDANQRTAGNDGRSVLEDSLLKNPNSLKARLDLAQIYRSAGELAKAREMIDSVLRGNPDLPDALYASAQLYAEQHLWWEVLHTLEKVSPVSRTAEMGRLQKVGWAHVQIDRADALVRQGDNAGAEVLLRRVAAELVVSYNQTIQPEPPPLWGSGQPAKRKGKH